VVIFPPVCDAPLSVRPKTVTTPENIDQIYELILEDRRILAKSIVEWVPKGLNVNGANRLNNFRNFFGAIQVIS
jgi:hypothetical protein